MSRGEGARDKAGFLLGKAFSFSSLVRRKNIFLLYFKTIPAPRKLPFRARDFSVPEGVGLIQKGLGVRFANPGGAREGLSLWKERKNTPSQGKPTSVLPYISLNWYPTQRCIGQVVFDSVCRGDELRVVVSLGPLGPVLPHPAHDHPVKASEIILWFPQSGTEQVSTSPKGSLSLEDGLEPPAGKPRSQ